MKLGKILGIDVAVHWTLFLFIVWTALSAPFGGFVANALLLCCVFGCVLLHEFGHSLAARGYGIDTSSIVLYPIGGVATLERMPRAPKQELWIALAGPLVNVVIAASVFLLRAQIAITGSALHSWLTFLLIANMGLVLFNMVPAFPMDGGRVLRALAAMRLPYVTATNLAATIGKIVAVGLAIVGFSTWNFMLVLIAGFIYLVGSAEARAVAQDAANASQVVCGGNRSFRNVSEPHRTILMAWDETRGLYRCVS